jgi:protein FRG1
MSEVVSKKLKFKGDKPKKKKRSHKEEGGGSAGGGGLDDLAVLAAADPRGVSCFSMGGADG